MSKETKEFIKDTISVIIIAFILAAILRNYVIEGREIPTGSMLPTVQLKDRVWVNRFIYRFKEPVRGTSSCSSLLKPSNLLPRILRG